MLSLQEHCELWDVDAGTAGGARSERLEVGYERGPLGRDVRAIDVDPIGRDDRRRASGRIGHRGYPLEELLAVHDDVSRVAALSS